jgi:hypothetical protein
MGDPIPYPSEEFDAMLVELEAKHKRIGIVEHPDDKSLVVVLRKMSRAEFTMFSDSLNNPQRAGRAVEAVLRQTCVYPEGKTALEALMDDWTGVTAAVQPTIMRLAGMVGVEHAKV